MLQSQYINFSYDGTHQFCFPDIQLSEGEELLILGESGVGKTTLIQILAGLLKPSSGLLEFNGVQFHNLPSKELDQFRGKHIGMVFQSPYFVKNISILDNLLLSLYLSNNKEDKKRAFPEQCQHFFLWYITKKITVRRGKNNAILSLVRWGIGSHPKSKVASYV